ncbi:hypothetical protein GLOIN_2v1844752 [Rhizophagus clarus]|uniref:Uncharacterized protein n=1 Tax=Rhizophagus clarus TaxID=94130 RepID=A0A8H3L8L5_9GLOM|nr:hypothetical protein GLOIN_2v1844752 [Rhizophagus clarus]
MAERYNEFIKEYGLRNCIGVLKLGDVWDGEDSIAEYYSKLKRCNDTVNLCKDHFEDTFFEELSTKYMSIVLDFNPIPPHDEWLKILIQRQNKE